MAEVARRGVVDGAGFKARLLAGDPLLGTFVKTPAPQGVEVLASVGFDFVMIDQEHAPLGRESVDLLLLAARARRLPALVRVGHVGEVGQALDCGADGVVVPHVGSAADAEAVVAACRYVGGRRGYSNSPRAGDYGRIGLADHVRTQDEAGIVVVMIEEAEAVVRADEICGVEGVDAVLIGCADLAVSMGAPAMDAPDVRHAVRAVARAATAAGRRPIAPAASVASAAWLLDMGVDALVVGSDQGLLRAGATAARCDFVERRKLSPGQAA